MIIKVNKEGVGQRSVGRQKKLIIHGFKSIPKLECGLVLSRYAD